MSQSSRMHHLKNYGDKFLLHSSYGVADYLNPFQSFIASALKLGGATVIEKKNIFERPHNGSDTVE